MKSPLAVLLFCLIFLAACKPESIDSFPSIGEQLQHHSLLKSDHLDGSTGIFPQTLAETPAGDILIAGQFEDSPWLTRLDASGEVRWAHNPFANGQGKCQTVYAVGEDALILGMEAQSSGNSGWEGGNPFLVRLDAQGDLVWKTQFTGQFARGLKRRDDQFFLMLQTAFSNNSQGNTEIVSIDLNGAQSSLGFVWLQDESKDLEVADFVPTLDGGFAWVAGKYSGKLTSALAHQWRDTAQYSQGPLGGGTRILELADSSLLIGGGGLSDNLIPSIEIRQLAANGEPMAAKFLGSNWQAHVLVPYANGGYLLAGTEQKQTSEGLTEQYLLMSLDNQLDPQWQEVFSENLHPNFHNALVAALPLQNGNLALLGYYQREIRQETAYKFYLLTP